MAKKQFKAESKRLLDLMINSIYTNKEIFLRELISNASDAIDKLYYESITKNISGVDRSDFYIRLTPDEENKTLIVSDNGKGMTKEEMEENLGVIAKSGSFDFKAESEKKEDIDIIGQFGVGFYSAFMVSKNIKVISKAYGSDEAYAWESSGADGYSINKCEKDSNGTDVILTLKDDTDDDKYSQYTSEYTLRSLITHYSDYIRYPIMMNVKKKREISASDEEKAKEDYKPAYEDYIEDDTLNSMVPIWKRSKSSVTDEEYNEFYKTKFYDYTDPLKVIHSNIEGALNYCALLYIPSQAPYNYYTKDYEKGLQLYSSGVLIMEKCADLLPDYFSFVKGLIDSQELSLNISREMLQHDRQLKLIAVRIEKKIKSELLEMQAKERDKYEVFFKNFGMQLKYGIYSDFGANKDSLKELVMFYSSFEDKYTTFAEYISRMKPDQKYIYYACAESIEKISKLPQTELLKDKGYEILYCTDDIDEFALNVLHDVDEKEFRSVAGGDLGIEQSEEEKKKTEEYISENKELLEAIKNSLGNKVKDVKISSRLKTHAVCFASGEGLSMEMAKVINQIPNSEKVHANKILELNAAHPVFEALKKEFEQNKDSEKIKTYAKLLYDQALLIEGIPVDDPVAFSNDICKLMI